MSVLLQHQYVAAMMYDPTPLAQRVHHLDNAMEQKLMNLSQVVRSLQERLGRWETDYLPPKFERVQEISPLPTSPPVTPLRQRRANPQMHLHSRTYRLVLRGILVSSMILVISQHCSNNHLMMISLSSRSSIDCVSDLSIQGPGQNRRRMANGEPRFSHSATDRLRYVLLM